MYFDILIGLFIPYNCFVLQPNGHEALSTQCDCQCTLTNLERQLAQSNSRLCLILFTNPCISFLSQRPWEV